MLVNRLPALYCALLTSCTAQPAEPPIGAPELAPSSCVGAAQGAQSGEEQLEVWVDLSEPPLSSRGERDQHGQREKIQTQQDQIASALRELGATELARVSIVRNALAICLPSRALDDVRRLQGVVKVRPVKHRQKTP